MNYEGDKCDRILESIECLRGLKNISAQFQYSTQAIKEIDEIFTTYDKKTKRLHRQLILKLRSAIKLNCDKKLFTEEQINLLEELTENLRSIELKKNQVLAALDQLIDADLLPFPILDDNDG